MITADLVTPLGEQASWVVVGKRLLRNKAFLFGGSVVLVFLLLAFFPQLFTHYNPIEKDLASRLLPPSAAHWFGTDDLGRDVCARIIYGAQVSLRVGLLSVGIALIVGP